jgi:Bacterial Ig-like domain (group 1)
MSFIKWMVILTSAVLISACGGGGGSPGNQPGVTPPVGGSTVTATVADFQVGFNKNTLSNTGSDEITLNVTAVNAGNNVVPGAPVTVIVDSQAVFIGSGSTTDETGRFTGKITSPTNKVDRIINVTVQIGTLTKNASLRVAGSQITVSPSPSTPLTGDTVTYSISLKDANNNAIADSALTIAGSAGLSGTLNTDSNGNAVIVRAAPIAAGTYTIVVTGSGVTTTKALLVINPASPVIVPNATTLTIPSLNGDNTNIRPNLANSTTNRSVMTFRMVDQSNQGIQNVRVRFSIEPPSLGAGETISTGNSILLTDASGVVQSDYIAGVRSSPTNGVKIRACYASNDAALAAGACPAFVDANLTVSGQALNLSIFSNNVIEPLGIGNILYRKTYQVQVADSAGNPVRDALVSASIDITHYGKGTYSATYALGSLVPPSITDNPANGTLNTVSIFGQPVTFSEPGSYSFSNPTQPTQTVALDLRIWCPNEDLSRNGILDPGEDINNNRTLEPRASDVIVLAVGSNVTDSTGNVTLQAQWGQNVGSWLAFTLKVTTNVGGSEGTNSRPFITSVLQADVPNGAFRVPPYGINNCSTNN